MKLNKIIHKGNQRIKIEFAYNQSITTPISKLKIHNGAKPIKHGTYPIQKKPLRC